MTIENTLLKVIETSVNIKSKRTYSDILLSMVEEVGELSTEVQIVNGKKNIEAGPDGIIGECVDVMLTSMDLAVQRLCHETGITNITELNRILAEKTAIKLEKWITVYSDK